MILGFENAEGLARRSRQPKMSSIAVRATAIRIGETPLLRGQQSPVSNNLE
jgi:hypothetical protein